MTIRQYDLDNDQLTLASALASSLADCGVAPDAYLIWADVDTSKGFVRVTFENTDYDRILELCRLITDGGKSHGLIAMFENTEKGYFYARWTLFASDEAIAQHWPDQTQTEPKSIEMPAGFESDTEVLLALELKGMDRNYSLTGQELVDAITHLGIALEGDEDRLALYLTDHLGERVTIASLVESGDDWARQERDEHVGTYGSKEEFAREAVESADDMPPQYIDNHVDWDALADDLLADMSYTEGAPTGYGWRLHTYYA